MTNTDPPTVVVQIRPAAEGVLDYTTHRCGAMLPLDHHGPCPRCKQ